MGTRQPTTLRCKAILAGVLLLACASVGAQQVYRWIDKDGRVHYSEQPPPPDARSVERRRVPVEAADSATVGEVAAIAKKNPVIVYVSPDCDEPCKEARDLLARRGIPHKLEDVNDLASFERLKKATGGEQVPVLVVGSAVSKGFEEGAWNAALDAAGYPRKAPAPVRVVQPQKPPPPKPPARGRYESAPPPPEPSVVLYVSEECGSPCDDARKLLANRKVKVNVVSIIDPASFDELQRISGGVTVPVMVAGTRVVKGFEAGQYDAALESIETR